MPSAASQTTSSPPISSGLAKGRKATTYPSAELKRLHREKRRKRVRRKIVGTAERPRLSVYRSNVHIYAQLIDDDAGNTLALPVPVGERAPVHAA